MAHTFDTKAQIAAAVTDPQAVNYTCGAGATLLVVSLIYTIGTRTGAPTYNGVALTQADQVRQYHTGPEVCTELWYLIGPPTGSAYSVSVPNPNGLSLEVCISSYKAASGYASAFHLATGGSAFTAAKSVTITTLARSVLVASVASGDDGFAPTARSGTSLYETDNGTWGGGHQYLLQAAAGAQAMSWTDATSEDWGICIAAFHEVPVGISSSKDVVYGVLSQPKGISASKVNLYSVIGTQPGVSKGQAYEVLGPPAGADVSKGHAYEVLSPPVGASVGKGLAYVVLQESQQISQFIAEAITGGYGAQEISQFIVEAIVDVQGVKVSQFPVEVVWGQTTPLVDISQAPIEVIWGQSTPLVDLSQFVVEVIVSPPSTYVSQAPVNAIWGMTEGTANVSQTVANAIWGVEVGTAQVSQIVVNAIIEPGYSYIGTGGIKFGGTAAYVFEPLTSATYEWTGTGGIKFGGSATTEGPAVRIYSYTGTGGIKFGGSGGVWKNFRLFTGTGGIKFGGTAPYEYGISIAAEALEVLAEGDGETEISQATMAALTHADEDLSISQVTTTALIRRKRQDFMPMLTRLMMEHQKEKR